MRSGNLRPNILNEHAAATDGAGIDAEIPGREQGHKSTLNRKLVAWQALRKPGRHFVVRCEELRDVQVAVVRDVTVDALVRDFIQQVRSSFTIERTCRRFCVIPSDPD